MGWEVTVKGAEVGWLGVIKKSFQKHLVIGGWVKAKIVHLGNGVERASPPLPLLQF